MCCPLYPSGPLSRESSHVPKHLLGQTVWLRLGVYKGNKNSDGLIVSIAAPSVSGKKAVFEATGTVRAGEIISLVLPLSDWRTDRGRFYTIIARRLDDHPSINPSAGICDHRPTI